MTVGCYFFLAFKASLCISLRSSALFSLYMTSIKVSKSERKYNLLDVPLGFEPRLSGSEPVILPLDDGTILQLMSAVALPVGLEPTRLAAAD